MGWRMVRCICFFVLLIFFASCAMDAGAQAVKLPAPRYKGDVSVEEAIYKRKSIRSYEDAPLSMEEVSQLLWSAGGMTVDGVTGPTRAYASAGGLYPLEIYIVAGNVTGLDAGIYRYDWKGNSLIPVKKGDMRKALAGASLGQRMIASAPATIIMTMLPSKLARYGQRGMDRYVSMDAGHLGENIHLQAEALGLGTVMVGAFSDKDVAGVLGIDMREERLKLKKINDIPSKVVQ